MAIKCLELIFHPEAVIRKTAYKILASIHAVSAAKSKNFILATFILSLGEYNSEKWAYFHSTISQSNPIASAT